MRPFIRFSLSVPPHQKPAVTTSGRIVDVGGRSITKDDRDFAGLAGIHRLVGLAGPLERELVGAGLVRMHVPARHPLDEILDVAQVGHPGAVDGLLSWIMSGLGLSSNRAALAYEGDATPLAGSSDGELTAVVLPEQSMTASQPRPAVASRMRARRFASDLITRSRGRASR